MLIAEDLLLLLTDDSTGKLAVSSTLVDIALGGALLVEITISEHVDVAGPDERVQRGAGSSSATPAPLATRSSTGP